MYSTTTINRSRRAYRSKWKRKKKKPNVVERSMYIKITQVQSRPSIDLPQSPCFASNQTSHRTTASLSLPNCIAFPPPQLILLLSFHLHNPTLTHHLYPVLPTSYKQTNIHPQSTKPLQPNTNSTQNHTNVKANPLSLFPFPFPLSSHIHIYIHTYIYTHIYTHTYIAKSSLIFPPAKQNKNLSYPILA